MDLDKSIIITGNSKPVKKQIIIPDSARKRDPGERGSYVNTFVKRIQALILEADLAPSEKSNINSLINKEVEIVFRDAKRTPEQREQYWIGRKRSDKLNHFLDEMAQVRSEARAIAAKSIRSLIRKELPDGYEMTADDVSQVMSRFERVNSEADIGEYGTSWIRNYFGPMVRGKHRKNLEAAKLAEKQLQESKNKTMRSFGNQQVS